MSNLLIVDGNNLAHKCRHVFSLTTPAGMDCSVTYGFLKVLWSYLQAHTPDACVVCWDGGGIPKHRRERFPGYKANRVKGDPDEYADFVRQMKELNTILSWSGVLSVRKRYIEADDLMYHAAFLAKDVYKRVAVASSDDDMYQVVNISNNVFLWDPNKKEFRDAAWLADNCGVPSTDYVHWRALQGDPSDGVDGVVGVGPKTATKLFQQFKSLPGILNAVAGANPVGKLEGKVAENIQNFGSHNLTRNVFVMALAFDRTGARHTLLQQLKNFHPANIKHLKTYLYKNAFVSLMDGGFYGMLENLRAPSFDTTHRTPLVCHYREAVT